MRVFRHNLTLLRLPCQESSLQCRPEGHCSTACKPTDILTHVYRPPPCVPACCRPPPSRALHPGSGRTPCRASQRAALLRGLLPASAPGLCPPTGGRAALCHPAIDTVGRNMQSIPFHSVASSPWRRMAQSFLRRRSVPHASACCWELPVSRPGNSAEASRNNTACRHTHPQGALLRCIGLPA